MMVRSEDETAGNRHRTGMSGEPAVRHGYTVEARLVAAEVDARRHGTARTYGWRHYST